MRTLPYIDTKEKKDIPLIVVEPFPKTSEVTDTGIFIPADVGEDCEEGRVISCGISSAIPVGSRVVYKKIDRTKKENYETVEIDGKTHDIISESEIWEVDEKPFNRVFVRPLSEAQMDGGGIFIPHDAEGITEKGIIVKAPDNFFVKVGDHIEYRKNTMQIYHIANIDGVDHDILYEPDIFTVNGKVSPYKIIIKIDMAAQRIKRQTSDMGLAASPLFQRMTRFLQYGKVMEIGTEAQKMYPDLNVGNHAILHHGVEYDEFRLLKTEPGQHAIAYEYRVINCFDINQREIFGKFSGQMIKGKMQFLKVTPFHKNIFLKWKFEMLEKTKIASPFVDVDFSLDEYTNKEDLEHAIAKKSEESVLKYKMKWSGYNADLALYNPNIEEENNMMRVVGGKIAALKREAEINSAFIRKDHILKCVVAFPKEDHNRVLTQYKYLYPINILGNKFLIAHSDLIIARNMDTQFGWQPIADKVIVKPIKDADDGNILVPDSAKEATQKGFVIAVAADINPDEIQPEDTIYHRKMAGTEIIINKERYIMLYRDDIFLSPKPEEREAIRNSKLNGAIATEV